MLNIEAIKRLGITLAFPVFLALGGVATPAFSQTQAPAQARTGLDSDEPIEIESDRLEVRDEEHLAIFTGNVKLVQGKVLLRTVRMVVHYASGEGNGSLSNSATQVERIEAEGKVYLKSGEQVATGDKGEFDMKADTLVLTGKEVVMTENDNVVKGCKLTMQMSSGQSQVESCGGNQAGGRVIMLLQSGSKSR